MCHEAGLSGTVNDMRALHMGRIRVLGEPIHRDFPGSPFSSLQFSDAEQYRIYQEALKAAKPVPRRLVRWRMHQWSLVSSKGLVLTTACV